MQKEVAAAGARLEIHILGINEAGLEGGNAAIAARGSLPWLQDTRDEDVWSSWEVTYRDVVILDDENTVVGVYNLTQHNLAVAADYRALKTLLLEAAE